MPKQILSLGFVYARETKKFCVYKLSPEHEFFPKEIYVSKNEMERKERLTVNIITEEA